MSLTMDKISHALVWSPGKNKFLVLCVEEFINFSLPENKNDFVRNKFISINKGKLSSDKAILLALGSEHEMREASIDTELSTVTHALVNFLDRGEVAVTSVENIENFSGIQLKHRFQYLEYSIYHAKMQADDVYEDTYIHGLGDETEMLTALEQLKNDINYALVRYVHDDSLQVLNIENIENFNPNSRSHFDQWKLYETKTMDHDEYKNIQILRLGSFAECTSFLDVYTSITHALVIFKPNNNKEVIPIYYIQEFKMNPPETVNDFDKNKPYSGRLTSSSRYSAIQIFALGHEQLMNFNKINEPKRMSMRKFNSSDLRNCDKSFSSTGSKDNSGHSSDTEIIPQYENPQSKQFQKMSNQRQKKQTQEKDIEYERRKSILLNSTTKNLSSNANYDSGDEALNNSIANNEIASTTASHQTRFPLRPTNGTHKHSRANNAQESSARRAVIDGSSDDENIRPMYSGLNQTQRQRKKSRGATLQRSSKVAKLSPYEPIQGKSDLERFQMMLSQDSDSDDGSTEQLSVFERFDVHDRNAVEPIKCIHLGWSVNILYEDWKKTKRDSKDENSFISHLADAMFGKEILQLFLQLKPLMKVVNKQPRREVTDTEIKVIKQCLRYWICTKRWWLLNERPLDIILSKTRMILSEKISAEFKKYQQKKPGNVSYMESKNFIRNRNQATADDD